MMMQRIVFLSLLLKSSCHAFVAPGSQLDATRSRQPTVLSAHKQQSNNLVASSILAASLAFAVVSVPLPAAQAYDASDYASETVQTVIQTLKDASGNTEQTFKAFESIAAIITEGKGVGGMINYREYTVDDRGAAFCFDAHH
jgi:hypothetical protein